MISTALFLLAYLWKSLQAWYFIRWPTLISHTSLNRYPTSSDCAFELRFLQAVEAFLIKQNTCLSLNNPEDSPQSIRDKIFNLSLQRFQIWWELFDDDARSDPFEGRFLPPLDILMVWHSYVLSPVSYLEDCHRWSKLTLWNHAFPLKLINDCIGTSEFDFDAPEIVQRHFTNVSGLDYDFPSSAVDILTPFKEGGSLMSNSRGIGSNLPSRGVPDKQTYNGNGPWSVDMFHTMRSHCNFIRSGGDLDWINKQSTVSTLDFSRNRYLRFLLLHKRYPTEYFVPTWDIDLVWHTHQLWPSNYRNHHLNYLGHMLDHDITADDSGNVREWKLRTADLWKIEFSEALAQCFCDECNAKRHKSSGL
ncbi:unnamed protein product [Periconia digitata]|uniref:Uncharacterized protein n=1 Tax=Periconia digitata TaxID=1303443 RepID=A0A9W4UT19_9PLEO|nr:unnamed protein product [Periconia digitata]